jgi:hypothetical protein
MGLERQQRKGTGLLEIDPGDREVACDYPNPCPKPSVEVALN